MLATETEIMRFREQYAGNWVWRAVAALVETKDFQQTPNWMAQRLGVSEDSICEALSGLETLGIIRKVKGRYEKVLRYIYLTDREISPEVIAKDHVLISSQILGRLDPYDVEKPSFYRTGFFATNLEAARRFCKEVERLMKEFMMESSSIETDRVFAVSFSSVDVSGGSLDKGDKV